MIGILYVLCSASKRCVCILRVCGIAPTIAEDLAAKVDSVEKLVMTMRFMLQV